MFENITCSVFGGSVDSKLGNNVSAYDGKPLSSTGLYVALPYHFSGVRPKVTVFNRKTGKSVVCTIEDVGPWNTSNPYWLTGKRPQAESGRDNHGRRTNKAGIDISMAAAKAIGINGMGLVDWQFLQEVHMTKGELAAGSAALKAAADQHTVFGRPVSSYIDQATIDAAAYACINAYIQQHAVNVAAAVTANPVIPAEHSSPTGTKTDAT